MKLRSDVTRDAIERTPHRAFMRAMGLDEAAIARPMIGIVSMKGDVTPCNQTHGPQAEAAREGVTQAGGTPREFTTISISDGIAMNHEGMKFSLVSRELIADSIEAVVHGHAYDGLVAFGGCDKTLPDAMMGLVRCNVPGIFLYGGAALPGRFACRDVTVLDAYEAVGTVMSGAMAPSVLDAMERVCKPTIGACAGQFTANTMAMVAEVLGLTVPNSSMIPGVHAERRAIAVRAGELVMGILRRGFPLPRDLVTRRSLENAAAIVAATGGSTNAALHIPAIAHEAGILFSVDDVAEVFARTPLIGDLRPGGRYLAKDVHDLGGVSIVIRELIEAGIVDGDVPTVTGRSLADEHRDAPRPDGSVVRRVADAIRTDGGLVVLKGNLAPQGALLKVAGLASTCFEGSARVFDSEADCAAAVRARAYAAGDVLVIRYEGPAGGPGMRKMLGITALIYGQQMGEKVALLTDGPSRARPAACASATSRPRLRSAARWRSCATAIACASMRRRGGSTSLSRMRNWRDGGRRGGAGAASSCGAAGEIRPAGRRRRAGSGHARRRGRVAVARVTDRARGPTANCGATPGRRSRGPGARLHSGECRGSRRS